MNSAAEHLDDVKLLALVDGALDETDRGMADAHIGQCASCRSDLERLRRRLGRLDELLTRTDFLPPPTRDAKIVPFRRRARPTAVPWLRAASILLVVLGVAALATPARAWMAEWLAGNSDFQLGKTEPSPAPPRAEPDLGATRPSQVRFAAGGRSFTLWIERPQSAGGLLIRTSLADAATAEVVAGSADVELLVVPQGLRIRNGADAHAEYVVVVPSSVRTVGVRVGEAPPLLLRTSEIGAQGIRVRLDRH